MGDAIQRRKLGRKLCRGFHVPFQPFLHVVDLITEMYGCGTKGGGIEGSFFEANGSVFRLDVIRNVCYN